MDPLELWIFIFSTPGTLGAEAGTDRTQMSKSGFPKVWPHHYTRFFTEISKNNIRNAYLQANDGLWANYIFYKNSKFSKLDFMMKNRFLGMKMGSRTRPDYPRPRKTWKTDRKPRKTRKFEGFLPASENVPKRVFWRFSRKSWDSNCEGPMYGLLNVWAT